MASLPTWAKPSNLIEAPNRRKGPFTFALEDTQMVLIIYAYPIEPIESRAVFPFFNTAFDYIRQRARAQSEGPDAALTTDDDPFKYGHAVGPDLGGGSCHIIIQSYYNREKREQEHLTYGMLSAVMGGLRDFIYENEMYLGLGFDVGDEIRGKLGEGVFRPGQESQAEDLNA